jgi:hypothetical protein
MQKITGVSLCIVGHFQSSHSGLDYTHLFDGVSNKSGMNSTKSGMNSTMSSGKKSAKIIINDPLYGTWNESNVKYNSTDPSNIKMGDGYYQNYEVVNTIVDVSNKLTAIDVVKKMLIKNEFDKSKYDPIRKMKLKKCAYMHVRRGDFVANAGWLLPIEYYSQALGLLKNIEKIYICSDEIKWCKDNDSLWKKSTNIPIVYLENADELETLYYMMLCEAGAIIANSTFSAWGAMMGADKNPNSVIVFPSPWNSDDGGVPNALHFPKKWNQITHK